ncbi:cell division protein CrgA [Nocardia gamkensis]|uniref:cell division protein CrgA n=1 Tax=Nocardia gamkensis TaxID=352869 RepID=UPI0037C66783
MLEPDHENPHPDADRSHRPPSEATGPSSWPYGLIVLLGIAWLAVYYVAGEQIEVLSALGVWNFVITLMLVLAGLVGVVAALGVRAVKRRPPRPATTTYSINVGHNYGVLGQGAGASQSQRIGSQKIGLNEIGLVELIRRIRPFLGEINDSTDRADVAQALDDLEAAATEHNADPEKVRRRVRALERMITSSESILLQRKVSEIATAVAAALGTGDRNGQW